MDLSKKEHWQSFKPVYPKHGTETPVWSNAHAKYGAEHFVNTYVNI